MTSHNNAIVVFKCDFDKKVLLANFNGRQWEECSEEECRTKGSMWHFYWASVVVVRGIFDPMNSVDRLHDWQIINHFPNSFELARKDCMFKNIRRYCKSKMMRDAMFEFVPVTFLLPTDFSMFEEEFKKLQTPWILKPVGGSQGRDICVFHRKKDIKNYLMDLEAQGVRESYIISRYISRPLLIGGKKFDLRIYVLVLSFLPLRAFLHQDAFARFCAVNYDESNVDALDAHLTNVAVQKQGDDYNTQHGGKWHIKNLLLFIESTQGVEVTENLSNQIEYVIVTSLRAVQSTISNDSHCFELFGYDVLVHEGYNPWLIEVNSSPSLTCTTSCDEALKMDLINDTLNLVVPPGFPAPVANFAVHRRRVTQPLGGFKILVDDSQLSS